MSGEPRFKRVTVLTQYYAPEHGAPPIRLRAMVKELKRLGCEVRVVTGMPNYPTGKLHDGFEHKVWMKDEVDGVPLRRVWLYPASGKNALKRLANYLSFTATSTLALAVEPKSDLVFVEAQPVTLALPALLNRVLRGTPYVYNTPDLQVEYADEDRWVGLKALIKGARWLERRLMEQSLAVSTVTHAFIDHFHQSRGIPLEQLTFLPNGADTEELKPMPRDAALAARLGVGDRKVFTFAGTFAPYQGLEVILDTAARLKHRKDIVFLMVGNGPIRQQLIDRAEKEGLDNVLFRQSPFDEMVKLMSITTASLVVLRKIQIANKMRLSKAIPPLACAVPILYAGWGETAEIVEKERVGLKVEPEDPAELAKAVETLADNPKLRDELGQRGRALAEREFSWRYLVEDWVRQLSNVADGKPPEIPSFSPSSDQAPARAAS